MPHDEVTKDSFSTRLKMPQDPERTLFLLNPKMPQRTPAEQTVRKISREGCHLKSHDMLVSPHPANNVKAKGRDSVLSWVWGSLHWM